MLLHYVSACTEIETYCNPQCAKKAQGMMFLIEGSKPELKQEDAFNASLFFFCHSWQIPQIFALS